MRTCDICGRQTAYVGRTAYNGKEVEIAICDRCIESAQKNGLDATDLCSLLLASQGRYCPICGTTEKDFFKTFTFGCPRCYEYMQDIAKSSIVKVQYGTQHKGKTPRR